MTRRVLILVGVLLAGASLGAVTLALVPDFRTAAQDIELPASPCGASATLQASPFVFEQQVWMTYLCGDTRVIVRRFQTLQQAYEDNIPRPPCAAYPGFVMGRRGGCVPPDHPDAR